MNKNFFFLGWKVGVVVPYRNFLRILVLRDKIYTKNRVVHDFQNLYLFIYLSNLAKYIWRNLQRFRDQHNTWTSILFFDHFWNNFRPYFYAKNTFLRKQKKNNYSRPKFMRQDTFLRSTIIILMMKKNVYNKEHIFPQRVLFYGTFLCHNICLRQK